MAQLIYSLQRVSVIHLFNARFKEHVGDVFNARAAFLQCDTESDSDFVENVVMRSNMEKRHVIIGQGFFTIKTKAQLNMIRFMIITDLFSYVLRAISKQLLLYIKKQ